MGLQIRLVQYKMIRRKINKSGRGVEINKDTGTLKTKEPCNNAKYIVEEGKINDKDSLEMIKML